MPPGPRRKFQPFDNLRSIGAIGYQVAIQSLNGHPGGCSAAAVWHQGIDSLWHLGYDEKQ
jgi:hypothetical protein